MHSDEPLAYAFKDLPRIVGIGRSKLYQDVAAGKLTLKKHGRRSLVTRAELERYVAALPDAER